MCLARLKYNQSDFHLFNLIFPFLTHLTHHPSLTVLTTQPSHQHLALVDQIATACLQQRRRIGSVLGTPTDNVDRFEAEVLLLFEHADGLERGLREMARWRTIIHFIETPSKACTIYIYF